MWDTKVYHLGMFLSLDFLKICSWLFSIKCLPVVLFAENIWIISSVIAVRRGVKGVQQYTPFYGRTMAVIC